MLEWSDDLKIRGTNLFLDSRQSREICLVSHAHSDHIACHGCAIATPPTLALMNHRLDLSTPAPHAQADPGPGPASPAAQSKTNPGETLTRLAPAQSIDYHQTLTLSPTTSLRALPAGHVLGSAMFHITRPEGTLLYTGDYKLRPSRTVPAAELTPADVLVMESTYGLPHFRFPPTEQIVEQLIDLCTTALRDGRQPIVMGYSLGKAQEAMRLLADAGLNLTVHGAIASISAIYERFGVDLGRYQRYLVSDFHGPHAQDLEQRGVLLAPPHVARSAFVTRFKNPLRIMLSGWGLLKDAKYRYGVDHVLPLSDHADFDDLLRTVEIVQPKKVFTHHGYLEFAEHLRARGIDASLARPSPQLLLFG
jgi:Cft2 family RNA processing exonuclease